MAFQGPHTIVDRVHDAEWRREPLTLTTQDVADLVKQWPDEEDVMEAGLDKLGQVDAKALRITKKAQQAIAEAFGLDADDIWRQAR